MHSLGQEIQGFSRNRLKKQCTHVTTVTGRRLLERRRGDGGVEVEEVAEPSGCGFVEDASLDLQVGVVRPFLLLASQDAAHDIDTLQRYKVSHVLNVAFGVTNLFSDQLVYKTLQILDLPDTDITSYVEECSTFIDRAREQDGVVLVHCNAGVSRSSSVVIGYLMLREGLPFDAAYSQVKQARPSIRPNPGFYQQLQSYKPRGSGNATPEHVRGLDSD
ncbi:dual specificity protein phosphatase 19-like isoform X1 [Betta splendens]|uniref:Dual specificity protein phosphatase 19-like isoform X1 n=1 Tax=Betta splendens TaxID=158456 RepID=A0A6P7PUJ9_BETSP|nr:dual specificity protein phosphatase 19-like isoform X1 [Betta splendens]XP_029030696.1 dual specificity protein phosphatase 19-like isoform X1 [Betta splendens]